MLEPKYVNDTNRPSPLIDGPVLIVFPSTPPLETFTRSVIPLWRSRTKMSGHDSSSASPSSWQVFVSPGTRLEAIDSNATNRPSALIDAL
jgi:hypothetical protein